MVQLLLLKDISSIKDERRNKHQTVLVIQYSELISFFGVQKKKSFFLVSNNQEKI